ncbi:hypothetical protein [Novosphingobium nitrogenifigens]|nr:hypothetical protein [Novosphingobium nitrogenifigens]
MMAGGIKPLASLGAGLLSRARARRRVPLTFVHEAPLVHEPGADPEAALAFEIAPVSTDVPFTDIEGVNPSTLDGAGVEITDAANSTHAVPEVVNRMARLADALGVARTGSAAAAPIPLAPAAETFAVEPSADAAPARRDRRVAFTLRLDPAQHASLRRLVAEQGRSAQKVLLDALADYVVTQDCAGAQDCLGTLDNLGRGGTSEPVYPVVMRPRRLWTGNES